MKRTLIMAICALAFAWILPAAADSWKDESGKDWRKEGASVGKSGTTAAVSAERNAGAM